MSSQTPTHKFVDMIGYRVPRKGLADYLPHLWKPRLVPIGRTRCRVNECLDQRVTAGNEHFENPGYIAESA